MAEGEGGGRLWERERHAPHPLHARPAFIAAPRAGKGDGASSSAKPARTLGACPRRSPARKRLLLASPAYASASARDWPNTGRAPEQRSSPPIRGTAPASRRAIWGPWLQLSLIGQSGCLFRLPDPDVGGHRIHFHRIGARTRPRKANACEGRQEGRRAASMLALPAQGLRGKRRRPWSAGVPLAREGGAGHRPCLACLFCPLGPWHGGG